MDSAQLLLLLQSDPVMQQHTWGVFARDELPPNLLPGGYLVNTQNRDQGGEHWVVVWRTEDGRVEFMDSLGQKPEYYGWTFTVPVQWNQRQIQDNNSIACGAFCLYYLYYRSRLVSMSAILNSFSNDTVLNDTIVNDCVRLLL